jgi:hypothetical protein
MWNKAKTTLLTITLIVALLTVFFSVYLRTYVLVNRQENAPLFWYENCETSWPNASWSLCLVPLRGPVSLPPSFEMTSSQNRSQTSVLEYYFGIRLNSSSRVSFKFQATAPINFQLLLDEREGADTDSLASEAYHFSIAIINETQTKSLSSQFYTTDSGLYIFVFSPIESNPFATVTFDVTM